MKTIYYYVFYTLYNFWEFVSAPKIWSDAKATLTISIIELFIVYTLIIYYKLFINRTSHLGEGLTLIVLSLIFVVGPNVFLFIYSDKWKDKIKEFDCWPEKKNEVGRIIVWSSIIFIIINFIVACNIPH